MLAHNPVKGYPEPSDLMEARLVLEFAVFQYTQGRGITYPDIVELLPDTSQKMATLWLAWIAHKMPGRWEVASLILQGEEGVGGIWPIKESE